MAKHLFLKRPIQLGNKYENKSLRKGHLYHHK